MITPEHQIITVSKENADEYDGEGGGNDGDGYMEEGV